MPPKMPGLSLESLGQLNYLCGVLSQPPGSWAGFYAAQSPSMNFALRYQLAFGSYAVAALAQHTPAYRAPYAEALQGAIEKMLDVATWGYWRASSASEERATPASSGHVAVLLSPHRRLPAGPPTDPVARDNLQYSGHLSTMLGMYEKVAGDRRYDSPFTLSDPESGASFTYTHSEVAARIHNQMRENSFGGVCCEPGMAYVPCNNYALASNTLHDALHGTNYSSSNAKWLGLVRSKLVLKGPAVRGTFGAAYMKDLGLATPVAFNFTDAWGLAFMLPFDRTLVRKLYRRFVQKVTTAGAGEAYVGSSAVSEKMEISDVPINTGFGLTLARGVGDARRANALRRYAETRFDAGWTGSHYLYRGAPRTLQSTALYALADSMQPDPESFTRLFNSAQNAPAFEHPSLARIVEPAGRTGVSQAEYVSEERTLYLTLRQVGDPSERGRATPREVTLSLANIRSRPHVEVGGQPLAPEDYIHRPDGSLEFRVVVAPAQPTSCVVRMA
ncbi:MAG: hypothetical protein M3328_02965 [Chloroflexota bacterium]|nr:hypothetical protein [Chloroflexota bacterium]